MLVTTTKDIATIELSSNLSSEIFGKNNDNHILINGKPAYQYTGDSTSTDVNGNASGEVWYVYKSDGSTTAPAPTPAPTPAPAPEADSPEYPDGMTPSPTRVDVSSSSADVTLTIRVTDASGIDESGIPRPFLGKPGSANIDATRWQRISGDNKDGTYQATANVPTTASPGEYYVSSGFWLDIWGNSSIYSTREGDSFNGVTVVN